MSKRNLYKIVAVICAGVLLICGFIWAKQPLIETPVVEDLSENTVPEESNLNNLTVNLINYYTQGYKNVSIPGKNLINGSFANRTVFVSRFKDVQDLNKKLTKIELFQRDKKLSANIEAHQYRTDDVFVVAVCDNIIPNENLHFKITVKEEDKEVVLERELPVEATALSVEEDVQAGDVLDLNNSNYWLRLDNGEDKNTISKRDSSGTYYEYTRILRFISTGTTPLNLDLLNLYSDLEGYKLSIEVKQQNINDEMEMYSQEASTGYKEILLAFKFYEDVDEAKVLDIIDKINNSYFNINNQCLYIKDTK